MDIYCPEQSLPFIFPFSMNIINAVFQCKIKTNIKNWYQKADKYAFGSLFFLSSTHSLLGIRLLLLQVLLE